MAPEESDYRVQVAAKTLPRIHRTYGDVPPGALVAPLALGYLEIAVSMESAARAATAARRAGDAVPSPTRGRRTTGG